MDSLIKGRGKGLARSIQTFSRNTPKEINKQKPGDERERERERGGVREKYIGSLAREVGGWAPVGPAAAREFYFLRLPVLSSPPSVRCLPPSASPTITHPTPSPLFLFPPFSPRASHRRALALASPSPPPPPRTPVHSRCSLPTWLVGPEVGGGGDFGLEASRVLLPKEIGDGRCRVLAGLGRAGSLGAARPPGPTRWAKALALSLGEEILPQQQQQLLLLEPVVRQPSRSRAAVGPRQRPPTAMAGSDEVNRNECKTVVPLNTWVLISNFKVAYNMLRRPDGTFDRDLAEFLDRRVPPNARPVEGVSSFDHVIDPSVGLEVRTYRAVANSAGAGAEGAAAVTLPILDFLTGAPSAEPLPVILFFHGGSFAHSSSSSAIYDHLCRRFVKLSKGVVVSVNYRRAPEHRYPCAYDDGWTALKWAMSQRCLRSGEDAQPRVFLSGDSSGGNIAHHVAVRAADEGIKICGNILLNAMFGGTERTESERRLDGKYFVTLQDRDWYWKAYLPEDADRDHPACNPFGPNGRRLSGLPFTKSLIIVSGLDLTCDRQLAYAEGLREDGLDVKVVYREKATVGFYLLSNTDHYHEVMEEISDFIKANL